MLPKKEGLGERLTDQELHEPDGAIEVFNLDPLEEAVRPAQFARATLELPARHLAPLAGVQKHGRRRGPVGEADSVDAEELRVGRSARAESGEYGDRALYFRGAG